MKLMMSRETQEYRIANCNRNRKTFILNRVHSSFSLVENRDLLQEIRTANVISGTSQSQPFQNFQEPMTFFILYR